MEFMQLDRIFHFGGFAGLGRPIHTYEQREQDLGNTIFLANTYIHMSKEREKQMNFMPFNCQEDRGPPSKKCW